MDISAVGKTAAQLTELMSKLEKSGGLFVVGEVSQGQVSDTGEVPFLVLVTYNLGKVER